MIKTGQLVVTHVMNPKAMPRERLLGEMDPDTREWTDGVLTAAARQVVKEPLTTRSWVVCDGDVDPEWIESLNSVLDDNHLLTLPNGERINFGSNVNFLFETHDLRFASPATISRMGMIYLSDEDVDVKRVVKRWIKQQPEADRLQLSAWMEDLFYRALDHVLNNPNTEFVVRVSAGASAGACAACHCLVASLLLVVVAGVGAVARKAVWRWEVCVAGLVLNFAPHVMHCPNHHPPPTMTTTVGGHHDGGYGHERPEPRGRRQVAGRVRLRPHPGSGWQPGSGAAHGLRS